MRIGLLNSVILNGGDAGIVYGTCDAIATALPSARITVFAHRAGAAARYYPDLKLEPMVFDTWPRFRLIRAVMRKTYAIRHLLGLRTVGERRFLAEIKACDAIVYCGGGYLNDSYDMRLLCSIIEVTLSTGIPHMAYGHSVGPIRRPNSAEAVRRLLNRFELITARDEASIELLRRLGVSPRRLELLADAALAMNVVGEDKLSHADSAALRTIREFKVENSAPLIFMSVRSWRFPGNQDASSQARNLHEQLVRLAREILAATNWSICFLSTCQGRAEYGYDDSVVARNVAAELGDNRRVMVSSHGFAPRAYPHVIGSCADLVISMRMHLTIFSLLAGVPFVAIAYEKKSVELCRRLGLDEFCHEAADLDAHATLESAKRLYSQCDGVSERLQQKREELIALSKRNAQLLMTRCPQGLGVQHAANEAS